MIRKRLHNWLYTFLRDRFGLILWSMDDLTKFADGITNRNDWLWRDLLREHLPADTFKALMKALDQQKRDVAWELNRDEYLGTLKRLTVRINRMQRKISEEQ